MHTTFFTIVAAVLQQASCQRGAALFCKTEATTSYWMRSTPTVWPHTSGPTTPSFQAWPLTPMGTSSAPLGSWGASCNPKAISRFDSHPLLPWCCHTLGPSDITISCALIHLLALYTLAQVAVVQQRARVSESQPISYHAGTLTLMLFAALCKTIHPIDVYCSHNRSQSDHGAVVAQHVTVMIVVCE